MHIVRGIVFAYYVYGVGSFNVLYADDVDIITRYMR